jgi:hypothetical protein
MEINEIKEVLKKIYENADKIYKARHHGYSCSHVSFGNSGSYICVSDDPEHPCEETFELKDILNDKLINKEYDEYLKKAAREKAEWEIKSKERKLQEFNRLKKELGFAE